MGLALHLKVMSPPHVFRWISLLAALAVFGGHGELRAAPGPKARLGWKRGRIHVRTLAKAMAKSKQMRLRDLPQPDGSLSSMAALLRAQKPRQDFPWPARSMEPNVGKGMVPFYPLVDERGWIRRADLRRHYGAATLRTIDALLERTNAGEGLSRISWNGLMQRIPDTIARGMIAGQRLLPKMRAFSSLLKRFGKLKATYLEMRGQFVGNTAALLLRGGSKPRRTHLYGKSYSFDARVGALLHLEGHKVEGTRFRDGQEHLGELKQQEALLYAHLAARAAAGDAGAASLRKALEAHGGLLTNDPWAAVEKREDQRIRDRIDARLAKIRRPERIKRPIYQYVDDGGDLLEVVAKHLAQPKYAPYRHLFCGVEQTSKGHRRMQRVEPPFHVVSMAKSWAKNIYGNPMFGHAISKQARGLLAELAVERSIFVPEDSRTIDLPQGVMHDGADAPLERHPGSAGNAKAIQLGRSKQGRAIRVAGLKLPKKAVVLGANGKIGKAVIRSLLAAGYQVGGYDKAGIVDAPAGMKTYTSREAALAAGHVLISATGEQTIGPAELEKLPDGAVVINGGSAGEFFLPRDPARRSILYTEDAASPFARLPKAERARLHRAVDLGRGGHLRVFDLEINGEQFVRFKGTHLSRSGVDPHEVWVTKGGKEILVARGGGVINFPLDVSDARAGKLIPGRYIQLEIGLLHLAMLQAQKGGEPGLHALQRPPQESLVKEVQADLAPRRESLLAPSF